MKKNIIMKGVINIKRIDKIYTYIEEITMDWEKEEVIKNQGLSAIDVSNSLNILRNNVSMELNTLLRQDKIIKIKGRPVLYIPKSVLEKKFNKKFKEGPFEVDSLRELINIDVENKEEKEIDPFEPIIGCKGSLKNQIEQAKAAVLYPPNGLHTLILGPTGVGKTLFANRMYSYAKFSGKFSEESPFVVFNCADYYNNPQLLISQIFGHVKGSFTGAESDKKGLVEKADGGILFLDEIHRLPPEGQEMIFYFMDTGTFNKLGESERNRKANVLIICATTEDPSSSLLKTFVRRIPIVINIPSLDERPIKERFEIIKTLIANEAHRVNKPIKVTVDVVKALIGSVSFGNIGQLKSNIQLVCANGFLNSIKNKEYVEIDFKTLPKSIKDGMLLIGNKRKELEELLNYIDNTVIIKPEGQELIEEDSYEPPFNLYKIIEDKASILKAEGVDDEYINKFIATDINVHIKCFYDKFKFDTKGREKLSRIVDVDILDLAEEIRSLSEERLKRSFSERFLYALSLHISAFLKRVQENNTLKYDSELIGVQKENAKEYKVALEIAELIQKRYNVDIPNVEVIYITLLLSSIDEVVNATGKVGIIVAAHGSSTASSMVSVATKLLGEGNIIAIDMPLEVSPKEVLDNIIKKVEDIDMGKGVMLLVDMGSLSSFEMEIIKRTGVQIRTIDMVSTPVVLEALRKSNLFDMDLESIYSSLKNFKGYGVYDTEEYSNNEKVIVTICSTGEGTAKKLKEIIDDAIKNITDTEIKTIPVGIKNLKSEIERIKLKHNIIATVGVKDPKINAPFISLESLIDGSGEDKIKDIIKQKHIIVKESDTKVITKDLCEDSLKQFLTYLNPYKITGLILSFCKLIEKEFKKEFTNSMTIKIVLHVACALERVLTQDTLVYRGDRECINKELYSIIKKSSLIFKEGLNLELNDDEVYYICDMFTETGVFQE